MSCSTCYQAAPIPRCTNQIKLGTIDANTDVIVKFRSSAGRIDYIEATSDNSGVLYVSTADIELGEMAYEIIVIDATTNEAVEVTTDDSQTATCIEATFEQGEIESATVQPRA